ncbi:MAG TPA: carboxypeptidase regulatory-like domain-containing protein [Gemmataceae bacterium]|jgi:beta-lactamase regulating signal transducer with metallopeptidase domain/protocatechuate 3,4-dioxygenase beta subunit|nr:carboxypeptidase regulatory-like domain-containing protein [Gemmataceae bacterium]
MKPLIDWYPGDAIVHAGLEVLGMIAILVALTWALEHLLARRRAALASALWLAACVGVLLLPMLTLVGPRLPWRVALLPSADIVSAGAVPPPSEPQAVALPAPAVEAQREDPLSSATSQPIQMAPAEHPPALRPQPISEPVAVPGGETAAQPVNTWRALATLGTLVWALGSLWLAARLLHGMCRVRRLSRRLRPVDTGPWQAEMKAVTRLLPGAPVPELCLSADVRGPLLIGLFRPRIVLPETLLERGTARQIRKALLHERAHAVRLDPWVLLLQRLAVVLFWVHPLIYLLNRRLDHAREEVCDNHVLAHVAAPEYADTLLAISQICFPTPNLEGYLTMIPRDNLEQRVTDLLDERRDTGTRLPLRQRLAIMAALLLLLTGISAIGFQGGAAAQDAPRQNATKEKKTSPAAADKKVEAAPTGKVTGRVVNAADGRPVGEADVRLLLDITHYGDLPTRRTTTNAQGEFSFDGVAPGQYRLWSFHGNLASRTRMHQTAIVTVAAGVSTKPMLLTMKPGITVRVKVLNEADGKPIQGAGVRLIWTDTEPVRYTDKDGQIELPALTAETWHVRATAKDHAGVVRILSLANEQPATLEFKLPPGRSLQGRVTGEDGMPVKGAGINLYPSPSNGAPLDYAETDADGRYRLDYLPLASTMGFYADKLDYLSERGEFRMDPDKAESTRLDLVLKKRPHGGSVQGIVTDAKGKPIAGAEVANHGGSTDEVRKVKTDEQGKFVLENVYGYHTGGHQLIAKAKGFAPKRVEFKPGPASRPSDVAIKLEPGHRIKGRVFDETGKPVAGAHVYYANARTSEGWDFGGSMSTDKEGRFHFDSLPPDTPFGFVAKGYSEIPKVMLLLDGDREVEVTMLSQGIVKGRVVDASTGKPISPFNIRISFSPDSRPDEPSTGIMSSRVSPGETFASPRGQFILKDLMAGMPLQVTVTATGYRRHVLRRVVTERAADAVPLEVKLVAEDPAKLVSVRGKLLNHKGQVLRGAELRLIVATEPPPQNQNPYKWNMWNQIETGQIETLANVLQFRKLTTDADGSFVFAGIPADALIELAYWGKGFPAGRVDRLEKLSATERANLVVKALAPARITGTFDRKTYPEFSTIGLWDFSDISRSFTAKIADDGKTFAIDDLPPGTYDVRVYGPRISLPDRPGFSTVPMLGHRSVTLEEGKEFHISLGEAERTE